MLDSILAWLEPKDVYEQALLPKHERSLRMRISDVFWNVFMKHRGE